MACPYKDMLGLPGEGIHSYRLFGVAIADVIMTIVGAWFISFVTNIKFLYVVLALFTAGIVLHRFFCVRTTIDKFLFP